MPFQLLAVGDLHLGRTPRRLPGELVSDARDLGPVEAWRRIVNRAIETGVDVVALAGDVVEREHDFFEAYRELEKGIEQLGQAGISVVGVAGNHDVNVLPRLTDQIPDFHLIGRGGAWETLPLESGGETVTLHGWSFRQEQVRQSPLDGVRFKRGAGINLGLLHCDRDNPGSPYAPVMSRELEAAGLDGWLLGHIHTPDELSVANPVGYLGCVSGMDPGEPGDHGPWLFTIEGERIRELEQWVLAPLRWESLALDLTHLVEPEEARSLLIQMLRELDETIAALTLPPRAVGIRLRLTGRTRMGRAVEALLKRDLNTLLINGLADTGYFIERCLSDTRPVIALDQLVQQNDPPGLLARRLCMLDDPKTEEARRLIRDAQERLEKLRRDARWQALNPEALDDAAVINWLRRSGTRLLEEMLDQKWEATP